MVPDNLGWFISPGDYAEIKRHPDPQNTPRMLESCNTCGHPRRVHDMGVGDVCEVCDNKCWPIGHHDHPQSHR